MSSKIIVCDIEGTTTSISFVKENLFPYAAKNVDTFLDAKWDADETQEAVKMLRDQAVADQKDNVEGCVEVVAATEDKAKQIESLVANVKWQMQHDRKAGPLKNLQGLMWVEAYKAGDFKGHVYSDVAPAFEAWTKASRKIYIYSSGSAAIQKVHFEHSEAGDLAKHLSGYFDTKVGAKQEKASYEAIFKEIVVADEKLSAKDVLFLTDIPAEAKAAKEAGWEAILLKRPGNAELTEEEQKAYKVVESFAEVQLQEEENAPKRKIEDPSQDEATPPAKVAKIEEAPKEEQKKEEKVVEEKEKNDKDQDAEMKTVETEGTPEATTTTPATPMEEEKEAKVVAADDKKTEVGKEEKSQDVPMLQEDSKESSSAAEKTDAKDNEKKKKDEVVVVEKDQVKEKKLAEKKKPEDEEKMEVDSTTASEDKKSQVEAKKETEVKVTPAEAEPKKTTTPNGGAGDAEAEVKKEAEEKKSPIVEEEKKKDEAKDAPKVVDEVAKPLSEAAAPVVAKENGSSEDTTASSAAAEGVEEKKKTEVVVEKQTNGDSASAAAGGAPEEQAKPETNGTQNGNSAEAKAATTTTNGHQDNDSDKENDKSMEGEAEAKSSDEVSTTSATATAAEEDTVAAKKCAAIETPATGGTAAATPVPAEVEAES